MRGQYFVIGAIILCFLLFSALPLSFWSGSGKTDDIRYMRENIEREFPHALNLGIVSGSPEATLSDFTEFMRSSLREKFANPGFVWVFSYPSDGGVNVTVANFMGSRIDVSVAVGSDIKNATLDDGTMMREEFSGVPEEFTLTLSFDGEEKSLRWKRDKRNLYMHSVIRRGENAAVFGLEA